jgi:uncharacterized RDD family membrane protein YckC
MTQRGDMTSQDSGTSQPGQGCGMPGEAAAWPALTWPSPYLSEGQSVPEAYPAPAQPGQPSYGSPAGHFRPGQQAGSSQPGYAQPGYGQPGHGSAGQPGQPGQPGSGQRPFGRPGMGGRAAQRAAAMALRDPALAGAGERLLASFLDWILILGIAFLAMLAPLLRIWHELQAVLNAPQYTSQSAAESAVANVLRAPGSISALLTFWVLAFGIALAYFWVLPAVWGATLGKLALGLRVVSATDRSRVSVRAAGIRAGLFLLGPALFLLLPQVEVLGGLLWLADGLVLLMDHSRMQCLHDRLAGTVVIRKRWLDQQQAAPPSPW